MSRPIAARRRAPEVAVGAAGTALIHLSLLALLIGGIKTAAPMAPVYAVELVAAPLPSPSRRPAPEAVSRPVEPPDPGPPAVSKSKTTPIPAPKAAPKPKSTAPKSEPSNVKREPAPRSESKVAPAPGETPSTGTDAVNIKTPGLQFAYPEYLRNIVSQVYRRWA